VQSHLPFAEGHEDVSPALAFNTAVSFVTNTSWQSYAGEATHGHLALAAGLGVAAFTSAAVGMAAGVALVRGLVRHETDRVGNFWVDLVRGSLWVLLPLSVLFAVVLMGAGVVQNLHGPRTLAVAPIVILTGSGLAAALPAGSASVGNPGPHGLSEIVYAFTSSTNGNGSAFASLSANTDFYNVALGLAMLLGRYLPMIFVLALAGSFAGQRKGTDAGSLRTDSPLFVVLVIAVTLIVVGLEFFPVLALGPIAEGLM
jgi:K+-transporting ATPase A subunit